MPETIDQQLSELGLPEREARVYTSLLELGASTVLPIAQKAGLQRTYVYDLLDSLAKKGLVSYFEKNGRRRYVAEDPVAYEGVLQERLRGFSALLPQLRSIYNQHQTKPKVRFLEGQEGIRAAYEELLQEKWYDNLASPNAFVPANGEYGIDLSKRIAARNIKAREILTESQSPSPHMAAYQYPQQEVRYLPAGGHLTVDLLICESKIMSLNFEDEPHAVIIEGSGMVAALQLMFEAMWQSLPDTKNQNK